MKDKNLILIGMPGAGKSLIGQLLVDKIRLPLIETDKYIEEKSGFTVQEIFENKGENTFRLMEKDAILQILSSSKNQIISTGGGLPCFNQMMDILIKNGITIYLKVPLEVLIERLKMHSNRPLFDGKDLKTQLSYLMDNRRSFYERAHLTINANQSSEKVVEEILKLLS